MEIQEKSAFRNIPSEGRAGNTGNILTRWWSSTLDWF